MAHNPWNITPGLNNVGSFQVSGRPYATGSCVAYASGSNSLVVRFPYVTKWVMIQPQHDMAHNRSVRVAFSENGLHGKGASTPAGGYNFNVNISSSFCSPLDLKVSELWFMSNDASTYTFDVVAGLTSLPASRVSIPDDRAVDGTVEAAGPNWTGSLGVG
jgi:hypothetical protein|tara:strand:- start:6206 stop:6685 length:480 start_codon:yes stop_codon:yes gene_type:complete